MIEDVPLPTRSDAAAEVRYLCELLTEALVASPAVQANRDADLVDASLHDTAQTAAHAVLDGGRYHRVGGYHVKDRSQVRAAAEAEGFVVIDPESAGDAATLARALLRGLRWDWKTT